MNEEMSSMSQAGSPEGKTVLITPEAVMPIVNKYIGRISPAQRILLADGTPDSDTEVILLDMCTELVQQLTTGVLRILKPVFMEHWIRCRSQADDETTEPETFTAQLGDSLSHSFSVALHVLQEKCKNAEELTALVEQEISQKVNSTVSAVTHSPVLPKDPAVYVTSAIPRKSLRQMVHHATQSLRTFFQRLWDMQLQCMLNCCISVDVIEPGQETEEYIKSLISDSATTQGVSDILNKWSLNTPEMADEAGNVDPPPHISLTANEIVKSVIDNLHYHEDAEGQDEESSKQKLHLNMGSTVKNVRDFFTSQAAPSEDTSSATKIHHKFSFLKFAQKQFDKLKAELKHAFKTKDPEFLESLKHHPDKCEPGQKEVGNSEEAAEFLLPGAVAESPKLTAKHPHSTGMTVTVPENEASINFETIKADIESFFDILSRPENLASKMLKSEAYSDSISMFSKDLTDKIFNQLMAGKTYQIPVNSLRRSLSEPIICEFSRHGHTVPLHCSHEILYVMTEDTVTKYIQQLQHGMAPSDKTRQSEKISGALADIEELIRNTVTPPNGSDSISAHSLPIMYDSDSQYLIPPEVASNQSFDSFYPMTPPPSPASSVSGTLSDDTWDTTTVSTNTPSDAAKMSNILITALLMRLIKKLPRKSRKSPQIANISNIITRLSDKLLDTNSTSSMKSLDSFNKISKAVLKDLLREFSSPEDILRAALEFNDPSFDDAAVKLLTRHLNAIITPPKKKSAVARFFSGVRKALTRPFQCCTKGGCKD